MTPAGDGLIELEEHAQDKNVLAMRYQIYDACEDAIASLVNRAPTLTEAELNAEIENLIQVAMDCIAQRAPEYGYAFKSRQFVRGIVLALFDSCFLALDGGQP